MAMKWWNIETRNERGEYYRRGDWSIERPADWANPRGNFTTEEPPAECLEDGSAIPCDWDAGTGAWILDAAEADRQQALAELDATDTELARVVEDLVAALDREGVLPREKLPQKAVEKLDARASLRAKLS